MSDFESGPIIVEGHYDEFKRLYVFRLSDGTCKELSKEYVEDHPYMCRLAQSLEAKHG